MSTELAVIENLQPVDLFKPEVIDPIIGRIRTEALEQAAKMDISIPGNRKELASLAYKIARSKTFIDDQRKALVADEKKRLAVIDAEGRRVWNELESLQFEVRKPLTDWENAEKERVAAHEERIRELNAAAAEAPLKWQYLSIEAMTDRIREIEADKRDWQEFSVRGKDSENSAIQAIRSAISQREAHDAAQAELERLRAEAAEREKKEREDRIAREATERAEREAKEREEKAAREAKAREDAIQREKEAAEARYRKAEADRIAAEERAEREKKDAIEAERKRVEAEKLKVEQEQARREKDRAHKASIHTAAAKAIGFECDLTDEQAKKVVIAIAQGSVPSVKVVY